MNVHVLRSLFVASEAENENWTKDFTEVTMISLNKNHKATKYSDHRTVSLIAHPKRQ